MVVLLCACSCLFFVEVVVVVVVVYYIRARAHVCLGLLLLFCRCRYRRSRRRRRRRGGGGLCSCACISISHVSWVLLWPFLMVFLGGGVCILCAFVRIVMSVLCLHSCCGVGGAGVDVRVVMYVLCRYTCGGGGQGGGSGASVCAHVRGYLLCVDVIGTVVISSVWWIRSCVCSLMSTSTILLPLHWLRWFVDARAR